MSIIFFDIRKWEKAPNRTEIPVKGSTDYEVAKSAYEYIKKGNDYIFDGPIVTTYEEIVELIEQEYDIEKISELDYWQDKAYRERMVYMAVDNMVLSYDYFLVRDRGVSCYFCWDGSDKQYQYLFNEIPSGTKINKKKFIEEVIAFELHDEIEGMSVQDSKDAIDNKYNAFKKLLFTDKSGIEKRLKEYWKLDSSKVPVQQQHNYLNVLFLFYFLDKHGIYRVDNERYKVKILDALTKPRIQMIPNFMEHETELDVALDTEYLKNEIIKHLTLDQIHRIDRIYTQLFHMYNTTFLYIAHLVDMPIDFTLEQKELLNILERVNYCKAQVMRVQEYEADREYEDSIWEIAYHRYKGFIANCERADSYKSLEYAYSLGKPEGIRLFDVITEEKEKYLEIAKDDLRSYVECNLELIASIVSCDCSVKWIIENYNNAEKLCLVMEHFFRKQKFDSIPLTLLVSVYQSLYEVKKGRLKYVNNHKGYKGKKEVSLWRTLDNMEANADDDAFDYVWVAIIRRWCNYNECKYDLWSTMIQIELSFTDLIRMVVELSAIDNIDVLIEGLFAQMALPENYRMTHIKEAVETDVQRLTGYELQIKDSRIIREFENTNMREAFLWYMRDVIPHNDLYYDEEEFVFHLNMEYIAIRFKQNKNDRKLILEEFRHMRLGDAYELFERAIELKLPWFTEDFRYF